MELIFFDAAWSAPGRLMRPMLKRIAAESRLPLVRRLVDEEPELARRYGLSCVPELILVERERILRRWVGFQPEYAIRAELSEIRGADPGAPKS